MNYLNNIRDIRLLRDDAGRATSRRFISRVELETDEKYIIKKNTSYSTAYRINTHVPMDVFVKNQWVHIGDMEVDGLRELYMDSYNPGYENQHDLIVDVGNIDNSGELEEDIDDTYTSEEDNASDQIEDAVEESNTRDTNPQSQQDHHKKVVIRPNHNTYDNESNNKNDIIRNIHQMQQQRKNKNN